MASSLLNYVAFLGVFHGVALSAVWANEDDLARRSSWSAPAADKLHDALRAWWETCELSEEQEREIAAEWERAAELTSGERLELLLRTVERCDDGVAAVVRACQRGNVTSVVSRLSEFDNLPDVVVHNLRLCVGRWLALGQLYNEALEQLQSLELTDVADPATLLFYRGATHFRLRDRDAGLADLRLLLENEPQLPERYATVARLMEADLAALEIDSLNEVARIMDSIRVRLGHGRAGVRVRQEEQEVVDKLDKMIDELEKQLQQMQCQSAGGSGGQSSNPAPDSFLPTGPAGQGDVDAKPLGEDADWGDLPPKERQEALQQLGKEFPSHYRDVIEEYFRKLARDDVGDE